MPKVLIADDQPDVLTALRLLLKGEGYETKTAVKPAQVIESVSAEEFDVVLIDCAPTESVLTRAAYHASRYVLVPVRPEYFATIGFPLLHRSLEEFRRSNPGHEIDVLGVVINNAFYDGGNRGGPERKRAVADIRREAASHQWRIFDNEIPFSRGFPKMMRGDYNWPGNAEDFRYFAKELRRALSEGGHVS